VPRPADTAPAADRVLTANLNVFTAPELDPRVHAVRSWAWADGRPADAVRAALERDARGMLRGVEGGAEIAARYAGGKHVLQGGGRVGTLRALRWLAREVRAAERVLVGAVPPGGRDRPLWLALVAMALLARRPLVVYSETWLHPAGPRNAPRRLLDRGLAAVATTILVPGRVHVAHYERSGYAGKVRQVPAPYPAAAVPEHAIGGDGDGGGRPSGEPELLPELLFVGRVMPLKGLDRLLDLVDELDASGVRVRLVALLGDPGTQFRGGDDAYATRCLARLRARDRGRTEVHTAPVDVDPFYRRATLLVVPNRVQPRDRVPAESWGRVVPEALAAGLPVVSTDAVPSAVEHVVDGRSGTVVPWADDAALNAAVRRWLP